MPLPLKTAIAADYAPIPLDIVWAIEPTAFARIVEAVKARGVEAMRPPDDWQAPSPTEDHEGVAVIDVTGVMTKRPSMFHAIFDASSTQAIKEAVEAAVADDQTKAILLRLDSPGGTVDGLAELGDAVFAARAEKPVYAQVDGMCASAAYYVASQADKIFAGRMDMVGSIGTRMMLYDLSRFVANMGVKAIPIDTGEFKSAAAMGTEITDRQQNYFQSIVDTYFDDFVAMIVRGRGMDEKAVRELADGRIHLSAEADAMGLIDGVATFQETLASLKKLSTAKTNQTSNATRNRSTTTMSENKENGAATEPIAATYADLKTGCPGADSDFICSQLEKKATAEQAQTAWMAEQNSQLEAAQAKTKQIEADAEKKVADAEAAAKKPGVDALGGTVSEGKGNTDPADAWDNAVAEKVKAGMSKPRAIAAVVKQNPELHQEYLDAANA